MVEEKYEPMYRLSCNDDEIFRRIIKKFDADFIITGEVLIKDQCLKIDKH